MTCTNDLLFQYSMDEIRSMPVSEVELMPEVGLKEAIRMFFDGERLPTDKFKASDAPAEASMSKTKTSLKFSQIGQSEQLGQVNLEWKAIYEDHDEIVKVEATTIFTDLCRTKTQFFE